MNIPFVISPTFPVAATMKKHAARLEETHSRSHVQYENEIRYLRKLTGDSLADSRPRKGPPPQTIYHPDPLPVPAIS